MFNVHTTQRTGIYEGNPFPYLQRVNSGFFKARINSAINREYWLFEEEPEPHMVAVIGSRDLTRNKDIEVLVTSYHADFNLHIVSKIGNALEIILKPDANFRRLRAFMHHFIFKNAESLGFPEYRKQIEERENLD